MGRDGVHSTDKKFTIVRLNCENRIVAMDEEYVQEHICRFHSLVLKGVFQETKECVGVTLALGKYEPIFGDLIRLVGDTQVVVRARTHQRAS